MSQIKQKVQWPKLLIASLIILHILPIWVFRYFPSQDGPAHVYNAYVLNSMPSTESVLLRDYYQVNLALFPNWISHLVLAGLMYIVPPLIAEKILLSLIIGLLPISFFYFLNYSTNRTNREINFNLYGFFGFLFSYHYLLHMGFYNFSLSVSLYFFTLGYFSRYYAEMALDRSGIPKLSLLLLLCLMTYFCHILSFTLVVLSLTLFSVVKFYPRHDESWASKWRQIAAILIALTLLYLIVLNYLRTSGINQKNQQEEIGQIWARLSNPDKWFYLLNTQVLVYFTDAHQLITRMMLVLLGLLFIVTIYRRYIQKISGTSPEISDQRDLPYLMLSGLLTLVYFVMPWSIGSGAWINDRISLFILPVLLPFLSQDFSKHIRYSLLILIIGLSIGHLAISCRYYYPLNKSIQEFTSGVELIEDNKIFLGLSSDFSPAVTNNAPFTHNEYVEPFVHVINYYGLNNKCISLSNYEAKYDYFPLNWKRKHTGIIDYIVTWKLDPNYPEACGDNVRSTHNLDVKEAANRLQFDYDLIHTTDNLALYRHKTNRK